MSIRELTPLPYHRLVVDHLREDRAPVWSHFASDTFDARLAETVRLDLLKSTYALSRDSHADLYAIADDVASALSLGVPVSLYQGQGSTAMNAGLVYLPEAAAVVFHGPILERLDADETRALIAHELAHHRFWRLDDGAYRTGLRVLEGLSWGGARSVAATLRLYTLSTELFADRVALRIGCTLDATVRMLVKAHTGIGRVVSADFLAQAAEILAKAGGGTVGWSHPEAHVRALSLSWYASEGHAAEARIRRLVEGPIALGELDLLRREQLARWTQQLVDALLQPSWLRTDAVLGHARLMFDDYEVGAPSDLTQLRAELGDYGDSVQDYVTFVLLDFVAVDPTLAELALARAHRVAEDLGVHDRLEREVHKKLKRTKKAIREVLSQRDDLLARAAVQVTP